MNLDRDALEKLAHKPEVFAPVGNEFEAPAKDFVPGPYYVAADEVIPELGMVAASVAGPKAAPGEQAALPVDRRDFMRLFSASAMLGVGASACVRRPEEAAIPYVKQPVDHVPGIPTYYASTCGDCASGCGIVVKTREGRPVKIEGNEEHPISQGGLCAMGQAGIQGLYHPQRLQGPHIRHGGRLDATSWDDALQQLANRLEGKTRIGILTGGSTGHSTQFYQEVLRKLGSSENRIYTWEPNSLYAAISKAHEIAFGLSDLPRAELRHARAIVGIGSDFHDVGVSPIYFAKSFSQSQTYKNGQKGTFTQFESNLSLTGGAADYRHVIAPGSELLTALLLVKALYAHKDSKGSPEARRQIAAVLDKQAKRLDSAYAEVGVDRSVFDKLAAEILAAPSVVLAGGSANFDAHSTRLQLAAIMANTLVGAYGKTLLFDKGWMPAPVRAGDWERFLKDAADLEVLFVINTNPVFSMPTSWDVGSVLQKIPTVVSVQPFPNEVDAYAKFVLPGNHYLESWGDEQPVAGFWSARQPAVRPTQDSLQAEDQFLWLLAYKGKNLPYKDYRAYLQQQWRKIYDLVGAKVDYDTFFKAVLRRGFIGKITSRSVGELRELSSSFGALPELETGLVLSSPLDHRLQDGRSAHLPVLQEIGDGLTTIAWDTWVAMNPKTMQKLGFKQNQKVRLESTQGSFVAALYPLPGLHPRQVIVPRGNGHEDERSTISYQNGVNPLVAYSRETDPLTGQPVTAGARVKLVATNDWYRLATMQKHNDIANRKDIIKKVSLATANSRRNMQADLDTVPNLFPVLESAPHHWGMAIDLGKCHGCGACMAACALENNVPQVGREQILLGREMHWLRLDRYFSGDVDQPVVTFQPVMCQHCQHAPCEAVCPVFATTHDPEGMNAMTYNRCVGTRYCANACPYKVRRFNWWTYKWGSFSNESRLQDRNPRALNPDVTVRTRGVMEKCTFCVGRLRDAKHKAKELGREVLDGEVKTACQQTCPSDAIVFGNLNDPASMVSKARKDARAYLMLGGEPEHGHYGLKTLPNVSYLAAVTLEEPDLSFGEARARGEHNTEHGQPGHH